MNINRLFSAATLVLSLLTLSLPLRADISEPDFLIFGDIILDEVQITTADTRYTVEAYLDEVLIDHYRMGDDPSNGDKFVLRLPVDSVGERAPGHVRRGDVITVVFRVDGELIVDTLVLIAERGLALTLDAVDTDGGGVFDFNDPDDDNDLVPDVFDNCRLIPNPGQEDFDNDGIGDVCDDDDDNDDIPDDEDDLPFDAGESVDSDGDGVGDNGDNCVDNANALQGNVDGDGLGDACDPDIDEDGEDNAGDNCPFDFNPGQEDLDGDGVGDLCEPICVPMGRGSRLSLMCL